MTSFEPPVHRRTQRVLAAATAAPVSSHYEVLAQRETLRKLPGSPSSIPVHPCSGPRQSREGSQQLRRNIALDDPVQQSQAASGLQSSQQGAGQQSQLPAPRAGKVTSVTLIDSPSGALSGFPAIAGAPDLNIPGPFNDTQTGACQNVQQIKFDLSGIPSNEVNLARLKDGVAGPVGHEQPRKGLDGPSDPTKLRRNNLIAVADCPGIGRAHSGFPLHYDVKFQLYAFDAVSTAILAKATYSVNILKQAVNDTNPVNQLLNFHSTTY